MHNAFIRCNVLCASTLFSLCWSLSIYQPFSAFVAIPRLPLVPLVFPLCPCFALPSGTFFLQIRPPLVPPRPLLVLTIRQPWPPPPLQSIRHPTYASSA